jgi:hypothetical protein
MAAVSSPDHSLQPAQVNLHVHTIAAISARASASGIAKFETRRPSPSALRAGVPRSTSGQTLRLDQSRTLRLSLERGRQVGQPSPNQPFEQLKLGAEPAQFLGHPHTPSSTTGDRESILERRHDPLQQIGIGIDRDRSRQPPQNRPPQSTRPVHLTQQCHPRGR